MGRPLKRLIRQISIFTFAFLVSTAGYLLNASAQDNGEETVEQIVVELINGSVLESTVIVEQSAIGNTITDIGSIQTNAIIGSGNNGAGFLTVNQASGSVNSQANIYAFAIGNAGLADITIHGNFEIRDNVITVIDSTRDNLIVDSFNNTSGIVGVNQAAGNANLQSNIVTMALGLNPTDGGVIAMTDFTLEGVITDNEKTESGSSGSNTISNSFNNFTGIAQVNQAAGDGNIMRKTVSVTVNTVNF